MAGLTPPWPSPGALIGLPPHSVEGCTSKGMCASSSPLSGPEGNSKDTFGFPAGYSWCGATNETHLQPGDLLYDGNMNFLEALKLRHQRLLQNLYDVQGRSDRSSSVILPHDGKLLQNTLHLVGCRLRRHATQVLANAPDNVRS